MCCKLRFSIIFFFIVSSFSWAGSGVEGEKMHFQLSRGTTNSSWNKLNELKIYFAHQSVGYNIVEGIKALEDQNPDLNLKIREINKFSPLDGYGFYHSAIGKNEDPESKIDAFANAMDQGIGNTADIAFLKFCFVDIDSHTDIGKLFEYYTSEMKRLSERYPNVIFVHFTVPLLKENKKSIKGYIRNLFRKDDGFFDERHNIRRNEFNRLLLDKYAGNEPIFDLAEIESTFPNGSKCTFKSGRETYFAMVPDYTNDGGHLNALGGKKVAEQLLTYLCTIYDKPK
jgi:hypothetical protein